MGAEALVDILTCDSSRTRRINLSNNNINDERAKIFIEAVKSRDSFPRLILD